MNSAIYCEGYQDRAFLSAWLDWLAERDGFPLAPVKRPLLRKIKVDRAHVKQCANRQLSIVAGEGDADLTERAALLVRDWADQLDRLVLVVDADDAEPDARRAAIEASFRGRAPSFAGALTVFVWDPQLEVVIEKALRLARPEALAAIDDFLAKAPSPASTRKERAFAFCSAWEPDSFGETFFQRVWSMPDVRQHLETLVRPMEPLLLSLV